MENKISKSITFFSIFIFAIASYYLKTVSTCAAFLAIAILLSWHFKMLSKRFSIILMLIFASGVVYADFRTPAGDNLQKFAFQNVKIKGTVISTPKYDKQKVKFYLEANKINNIKGQKLGITAVSFYQKDKPEIKTGDIVEIEGKLKVPSKATNFGQFDYADYLKNQGIFTVIYPKEILLKGKNQKFNFKIQNYFSEITKNISQKHSQFLSKPQTNLLTGIVFGHRSVNLDEDTKQDFINSGTFHILAASGMQVALVLFFWCYLMRLIQLPYNLSLISGGIMIILYGCFTGFPASILRALLMAEFIIFGKLIDRQADSLALLLFVCSIMLLYNPLAILDIGFQLSFTTTFGLIFAMPKLIDLLDNTPKWLSGSILVTIIAQIFASPLLVFYFNNLPLYSILANILILPLVSIITFLGFLSGILTLIPKTDLVIMIFAKILGPSLEGINWIAQFFSNLPNSLLYIKQITPLSVILTYIFIIFFILLIKENFKNKLFTAASALSMILFLVLNINFAPQKSLEVTFFNVGNSDAILVKLPNNKRLLIDTGRSNPYGASSGKTVIDEYLKATGNPTLDAIILTHNDSDHIGGCVDILKFSKPKKIYQLKLNKQTQTMQELEKYILDNNLNITYLEPNSKTPLNLDDDVNINLYAPNGKDQNSNSIITYLEKGDFNALFMGDNEKDTCDLPPLTQNKPLTLLKLGHHGSKNSVDEKMINHLKPLNVVISSAKNDYNHPHQNTINLLHKHQINTYKTFEDNMLVFDHDKNGMKIKKYNSSTKTIE